MLSAHLRPWRILPAPVRTAAAQARARLWTDAGAARLDRRWPRAAPASTGRCAIIAHAGDGSGLARAAELNALALAARGYEVDVFTLEVLGLSPWANRLQPHASYPATGPCPPGPDLLVAHMNMPLAALALAAAPAALRRGRRRVAFLVWEMARAPASWARAGRLFDEIWAPSRFAADAFAGWGAPVTVAAHPVGAVPPSVSDRAAVRARLGLAPEIFVVGFAFDFDSGFFRKHPLGLIEAFRRAFAGAPHARLLVRTRHAGKWPALAARLAAAGGPDVSVIAAEQADLPMADFYAALDLYASLHRAEGFGLTLAEAALAGLPVLATEGSGPAEFLAPDGWAAVPAPAVPVDDPQGIYIDPGDVWAEPDLDAAAAALRRLAAAPAARAALAQAGRARALARLHPDACFAFLTGTGTTKTLAG